MRRNPCSSTWGSIRGLDEGQNEGLSHEEGVARWVFDEHDPAVQNELNNQDKLTIAVEMPVELMSS